MKAAKMFIHSYFVVHLLFVEFANFVMMQPTSLMFTAHHECLKNFVLTALGNHKWRYRISLNINKQPLIRSRTKREKSRPCLEAVLRAVLIYCTICIS